MRTYHAEDMRNFIVMVVRHYISLEGHLRMKDLNLPVENSVIIRIKRASRPKISSLFVFKFCIKDI